MMTRREKLLIRPWQLRRYNSHKKKVINAGPVVDFGPPPQRRHVTIKLKKLQKERERQMKIEEDNFKLLQHLGSIMRQKRVDDYWETKPPNFLRRVGICHRTRTPTPCEETSPMTTPEPCATTRHTSEPATRRSKCLACTPHPEASVKIPEERIPWEPPKKILTRRLSSSAVVSLPSDFDFPQSKNVRVKVIQKLVTQEDKKKLVPPKNLELPVIAAEKKRVGKTERSEQKIVVRQGSTQITVNFPSFAEVKLVRGKSEKYLQRYFCECSTFREKKKTLMVKAQSKNNKMISQQ